MKKLRIALLFLLAFSLGILVLANSTSFLGENERSVVKASNEFAIDLYNKLKGEDENVFFSPFSVFDALSMTYAGAKGKTETQMAKVLHITLGQKEFHSAFSKIVKDIKSYAPKSQFTLNIANALWCQKGFNFLKEFTSTIDKYYGGDFFTLNFSNGKKAANKINTWVGKQTNDKIKKIVGKINPLTKLILTNAIYFKGKWVSGFSTSLTKPSTFYVDPNLKIKVPLMYQEANFNYMENNTFQALEMPYKGGDLSMIVLLSKDKYGINELEKSLSASSLKRWISEMSEQKIKVYFPKFKLETGYELEDALSSMGMPNAFDNADFSGMDGRKDLVISKVIHKAYIDVNEKGTEAAAVTSVVMVLTCSPNFSSPKVPIFRADHPFIFFIIDKSTGSTLFMGKITNPM